MSCRICGRSSCTESFHSLRDQEAWEERQGMSEDVDDLRREIQDLKAEIEDLKAEIAEGEMPDEDNHRV
jgi:hypothetical protein